MANQPFSKMYDVEVVGGDQRTRLAEMLRANALNEPQGQMVSGWYVPPSWSQNLAHLTNTAVGVFGGQALDEEKRKSMQADYEAFMGGQPTPQQIGAAVRNQGQPPMTAEQAAASGAPLQTPAAGRVEGGEFKAMKTGGMDGMPTYGAAPQPQQPQFDKYNPSNYKNPEFQRMLMQRNMQQAFAVPEYSQTPQYDQTGRAYVLDKSGNMKYLGGDQAPVRKMSDFNEPFIMNERGEWVANTPYQQYSMSKSQAGAPRQMVAVNTQLPFKEQVQKGMGEALVKNYETLQNIPSAIQSLDRAAELAPKSFAGSMADQKLEAVKFLNNNLGLSITPDKVANTEELRAALFTNVMENLKKLDASPSQQQQQILQQSMGNIGTDPKAIPRIVNTYKDILTSKAKEHNRRVEESMQGPNAMVYPYSIKVNLPEKSPVKPSGKVKFLGFE